MIRGGMSIESENLRKVGRGENLGYKLRYQYIHSALLKGKIHTPVVCSLLFNWPIEILVHLLILIA